MTSERTPLAASGPGYGAAPAGPQALPGPHNFVRAQTCPDFGTNGASAIAEAAALRAVQGNWSGPHTAMAYVYAARRRHRQRRLRIKRVAQAVLFLVIVYFVALKLSSLYQLHCGPHLDPDQRGRYCPPTQ